MSTSRSCLECRRRKIRCDRRQPCAYCTRVNIECIYPTIEGSSRPQRRPRIDDSGPSASGDSPSRIQALENHVRQLESRLSAIEGRPTDFASPSSSGPQYSSTSSPGRLSATAHPVELSSGSLAASNFPLRLSPSGTTGLPEATDAEHARRLWNVYLTDIDPLLKLVNHQFVEDTLLTYPHTSAQGKAMLLAIFFAIRASRPAVPLSEYQSSARALETALQAANVLSHPNVTTLSAMTIYLTCGRVNMDQDYLRTMLSLLIQLATKLHLGRDPESLGYLPSESEQRRRLWWHIVALDVRTAEACGTDPIIQPRQNETKIPYMVSDAALRSQTFFTASSHAPCVFHAVVAVEMANVAKKILFSPNPAADRASQISHLDELHRELVDKYISRCKCTDSPLCRLTMEWCKIYWDRLRLLLLHWDKVFLKRVLDPETVDRSDEPSGDETLHSCTDILTRIQKLRQDEKYSRWAWLWQNCTEWDACAVALCTISTGNCSFEVVPQAWMAIDGFFAAWTGTFGDPAHQKRWRELETFRDWVRVTQPPLSLGSGDTSVQGAGDVDVDVDE